MLRTILFDLDGTLVPFFQDDFIRAYFTALVKHMAPLGVDGEKLSKAIWRGTQAMVMNDGSVTNRQLFWEVFTQDMGIMAMSLESHIEDFYRRDFDAVRSVVKENVDRDDLIRTLKGKGYRVVLATTPIFPISAIETRLHWVGLTPEDFALVTTYENSRHCKPNPAYYRDILLAVGAEASECLMIGNNPVDDMAAYQAGMTGYLVTDYIENPSGGSIEQFPHGRFSDLEDTLRKLPDIR